jgi:hypothetical protein
MFLSSCRILFQKIVEVQINSARRINSGNCERDSTNYGAETESASFPSVVEQDLGEEFRAWLHSWRVSSSARNATAFHGHHGRYRQPTAYIDKNPFFPVRQRSVV